MVFCGIENGLRETNKLVGTSDPLDHTPRPPVWKMSQFLLFFYFEGFPKKSTITEFLEINYLSMEGRKELRKLGL